MKISFSVEGKPVGWQRTGYNKFTGAKYTQEKTRTQEALVALAYKAASKGYMFTSDVEITVKALFPIPKSASKKRAEGMIDGEEKATVKPDIDNILKLVMDALNGIAYPDDKNVVSAHIYKAYSENPCTQITINGT